MAFYSPTRGMLDFQGVFEEIVRFLEQDPEAEYNLIVGSDSQLRSHDVVYVTAIVVHRRGKGGRYFYEKRVRRRIESLRQRILYEASLSLQLAGRLAEALSENGYARMNVEIHLDIGAQGETKDLIREIVGMVTGSGFGARIKPDSFGASSVADKYTK
ncbi:MAG: ribonuclease H-like YkuK family protein [Bacillota bacterium]|nr:ribonuclease H-like YkuK family protein [Bacillota bacterium]